MTFEVVAQLALFFLFVTFIHYCFIGTGHQRCEKIYQKLLTHENQMLLEGWASDTFKHPSGLYENDSNLVDTALICSLFDEPFSVYLHVDQDKSRSYILIQLTNRTSVVFGNRTKFIHHSKVMAISDKLAVICRH